jgi:hypothetical protein
MKSLFAVIMMTALLAPITFSPVAAASAKKYDRGTCIALAKQKYGIHVGSTKIRSAADRCVSDGPGAI